MTFQGHVTRIEDAGEDALVTVTNVRRRGAAQWRSYSKELVFRVPYPGRAFSIGRAVKIEVTLK